MRSPFLPPEVWTNPPPGTPPSRRRTRRSGAAAIDELLLDAAVEVLADTGPDVWAIQNVAKRAGTTTGAIYSRYENAVEFAVGVWEHRSRTSLRPLLDLVVELVTTPSGPDSIERITRIGSAVHEPDASLRTAVVQLVVARRIDELAEVVVPDLQAWLDEWGAAPGADPTRRAVVVGSIATTLGAALGNMPDGVPVANWCGILRHFAGIGSHPWPVSGRPPSPVTIPHPTIDTGDLERDKLVAAAAEVVATVGFANATISRISRRAGALSSSSYRHFPSKDELLTAAIDELLLRHYLTRITNSAELLAGNRIDRTQFERVAAGRLAGNLQPARKLLENLRLEVFLAAAFDEDLASVLSATLETADDAHRRAYGRWTVPERHREPAHLLRALSLGAQLVERLAGPFDDVDWRRVVGPLMRYLAPETPEGSESA